MNKKNTGAGLDAIKDEKKKKRLDNWGYYMAWLGFTAILLAAIHKLIKSTDAPKKDEYFV